MTRHSLPSGRLHPDRRSLLLGAAALLVGQRAVAASLGAGWGHVVDRARGFDQFRAIVVAHRGTTVLDEALRGPGTDRPVNVKSVSKTVVAAVLGAALDRAVVPDVTATLADVAPDLIPAAADPRVRDITLADLCTMQAGLERTSGSNYGGWVASRNWVANALSRPVVAEPGSRMLYSTGSVHVLGAALARASGQSLLTMTRDWIGTPLGIEIPAWTRDPQGFYLGGNEMALSPRAMVRFAEMYRTGGAGILSGDWVEASLRRRTRSPYSGLDYGYGWFLGRMQGTEVALARGYGGQIIGIAPALELSFAITSDPTLPARSGGYFGDLLHLIDTGLLPAAAAA
ncbi:serine hydrolase domain-containing protein [Plastorhodobacter daqingensis]|uniref:Serine hydrolase domain-containing protein n=1 Tax=Plastorhodobacter daqingensis TaxID=1387281 RepID=A0ABW2UJI2_9RHOB